MVRNKQFVYKKLPDGEPKIGEDLVVETSDFDLEAIPPEGGITVKNLYLSLDPYLRWRMRPTHVKSYTPAFEPNTVIITFGVGKVLRSDESRFEPGDVVHLRTGAEEYSSVAQSQLEKYDVFKIPADRSSKVHLSYYTGVLGMAGRTAWSSFYEIGQPKKGEAIWVSAAHGAVGQIVAELAKHEGLKVIGSVGSDEKLKYIMDRLGFDGGFNYKTEKPLDAIRRLAPDGIDIYYENVGGDHLEAAIEHMRDFGRIIASGQVSQYNLPMDQRYGVRNTFLVTTKRIHWQGFVQSDANMGPKYFKDHQERLTRWIADGSFRTVEDIREGIDFAPGAFIDMLKGKNRGKVVIKVAEE